MIRSLKKLFVLALGSWLLFNFLNHAYAKEITIIYSGTTHAMLYQCSCPIEPDGGVARRAALIKELRRKYPNLLLLDSGSYFAGGLLDEYTLNTELDMQRTKVNLKAMEIMKYDALGISPDEFNFGAQFFTDSVNKSKLNFISCNIQAGRVSAYIIKDISGVKAGIIGVSAALIKQKAADIGISGPKEAVASAISELKKKGVNVIILLSALNETENLSLIDGVSGIDVLIEGYGRSKDDSFVKKGNTLILKPSWQGRSLGKAVLTIKDNKITEQKVEQLRLSDKIAPDREILPILPRCFSDANCKKEGLRGECIDAGGLNSRCAFQKANKVSLLVITARDCARCNTEIAANSLKKQFPGLTVSYLDRQDKKGENILKNFGIFGLPVYLLGKEVEKEKNFEFLKSNLEARGDYYLLKPQVSGISFFLDRKETKGTLDIFISLYDKDAFGVLQVINEFNPEVHFLATYEQGKFDAQKGNIEIEECLRAVCVQKYYPEGFWNYISCRTKNIDSAWWEDCISDFDSAKIKSCARSEEAQELLRKNIGLNKELQIMLGPTYLLDNREIFGSKGAPSREELKKIIKR